MRARSVVLLSGGLDSTVNLYEAKVATNVVLALTFDYGHRAATREVERAALMASELGISHRVLRLDWFSEFTRSSLLNHRVSVPVAAAVSIDDLAASRRSAAAVWVPNRNGIFLNIAAAFAEQLDAAMIVPGFNREEAATFPDNSAAFMVAATAALAFSTANHVQVKCFTTDLNKTEIVKRGRALGVRFDLIWPCYFGGEKPCGECESCQRFVRAGGEL